jgi:UDP-N-acetylmuramoyl-L-alanyl-D-glutamate--2,6-diaminopimelate ligase
MGMKLSELAACVPGSRLMGGADPEVSRVVHDSRRIRPGDLFVALRGARADGHRFVQAALDAGAEAAVVESPPHLPGEPALIVAPDTREALGHLAHALAGSPTERLSVCGITGTNGKTTTTYLLRSVFESAGRPAGLIGTIAYEIGERRIRSDMTTPDATDLAGYFAEMVERGMRAAVMEVSSHALVQRRTAGIAFDVGAFTNLTPEHMDYHGDMPSYRAAKGLLFAGLRADAVAVLNAEDEASESFAETTEAEVLWYGIDREADVAAEDVRADLTGSRFVLATPRGRAPVRTRLLGEHNVRNCLTAAGCATALGLPLEAIVAGLEAVTTVRGRLEPVPTAGRGFHVLVDYAHTADAMRNALATVRGLVPGRLFVVFGCGGDRDREKRPKMAAVAEELADRVVLTSDNPRSEDPEAIAEEARRGFKRPDDVTVELDRRTAIERAIAEARLGDVVVIAGKGHETHQETSQGTIAFDDREVAAEVLSSRAGAAEG